jgi:WD40 repeat protein
MVGRAPAAAVHPPAVASGVKKPGGPGHRPVVASGVKKPPEIPSRTPARKAPPPRQPAGAPRKASGNSHVLPWVLVGVGVFIVLGGAGGAAAYFLWFKPTPEAELRAALEKQLKAAADLQAKQLAEAFKDAGAPVPNPLPQQDASKGPVVKTEQPAPVEPQTKPQPKQPAAEPQEEPPAQLQPQKEPPRKEQPPLQVPKRELPNLDPSKVPDFMKPDPKAGPTEGPNARPQDLLEAKNGEARYLAFGPDGKTLFAAYSNGTLVWWDLATKQPRDTILPLDPKEQLLSAVVAPDGGTVVVAYNADKRSHVIDVIDVKSKAVRTSLEKGTQFSLGVPALVFSPDGKWLVTVEQATLKLYDAPDMKRVREWKNPQFGSDVKTATFAADGKTLITGASQDNNVRFWDLSTGKEVGLLPVNEKHFTADKIGSAYAEGALLASSDAKWLAAACSNTTRIWDLTAKKQLPPRSTQRVEFGTRVNRSTRALAFTSDRKQLLVSYDDCAVCLWDMATGATRAIINGKSKANLRQAPLALTADDKKLAVSWGENIQLWDLDKLTPEKTDPTRTAWEDDPDPEERKVAAGPDPKFTDHVLVRGHLAPITALAFDPDGKALYTLAQDGQFRAWDASTFTEKAKASHPTRFTTFHAGAVSGDGKSFATYNQGLIEVLDVSKRTVQAKFGKPGGFGAFNTGMTFSPDGKRLATLTSTEEGTVYDLEVPRPLFVTKDQLGIRGVAFADEGKVMYAVSTNNKLVAWDMATGSPVAVAKGTTDPRPAFQADGASMGLALSRDGKRLAAGWARDMVRLWNVDSLRQLPALTLETVNKGSAASVAFSGDGKLLAIGCTDGSIQFWDVPTGKKRGAITLAKPRKNQFSQDLHVRNVAFSPDDKKFVATMKDLIHAWEVDKLPLVNGEGPEVQEEGPPPERMAPKNMLLAAAPPGPNPGPGPAPGPGPLKPGTDPAPLKPNPLDNGKPNPLVPRPPVPPNPAMADADFIKPAGKLDKYLGAVFYNKGASLLLTLPKGLLKHYSYPEFTLKGTYKIGASAYRPVLDGEKGLLYAVVPNNKVKAPTTRSGGSDLCIYDVSEVLEGKVKNGLAPTKTIPLGGFATHLCLSPKGDALYALVLADDKTAKAVRINPVKGDLASEAPLAERTDCLCLTRDGKHLFASARTAKRSTAGAGPYEGTVQRIDPATMKLSKTVTVEADPYDMDARDDGLVFLSGGSGKTTEITIVDVNKSEPIVARWKGVPSGTVLRLSEDQKHLYTSHWRSPPAVVGSWTVPDMITGSETPRGAVTPVPVAPVRGELTASPDGFFLLCDAGIVFHSRDPKSR